MATAYSDEVAVGSYNRIRLRVEYSGTSATCYMEFRRTSSYTGSWADSQASITFNGTTVSAPYSYSGTVGTSWVQLCNASGFSVSTSGGTYGWSFNNPGSSSVLGCSGTIVISSQSSAPTGISLSNIAPGTDTVSATVSITGWGVGSGNRYRELNVWAYDTGVMGGYRRFQKAYGDSLSSTITTTNSSEVEGGMNIVPNTRYILTTYANNGEANTGMQNATNIVTKAAAPTVSAVAGTDSITITYSTSADGGYYSKSIQYSIDGGTTWVTGATISSSSATSGTYTISGLTLGQTYSVQTRVSTTAGITVGDTLNVTIGAPPKLYGGGSQGAIEINRLYGSVNGVAKRIIKLYGSVNGVTKLIYLG